MVLALMAHLAPHYDVIAFDRPGHGGSAQTRADEGSPYAQAEMIAAGWAALGIDRPIVVGHSFGGAVAISLGIGWAHAVGGLLALAPICFPEARLEHVLLAPRATPIFGEVLARSHAGGSDIATLPLLRNAMFLPQAMPRAYADAYPFAASSTPRMLGADAKDSLGMLRALVRSAFSYASCEMPIRIMGGTHDTVVANARHGLLAAHLMPNASFEWLAGCGHMVHHFRQMKIEHVIAEMREDQQSVQP